MSHQVDRAADVRTGAVVDFGIDFGDFLADFGGLLVKAGVSIAVADGGRLGQAVVQRAHERIAHRAEFAVGVVAVDSHARQVARLRVKFLGENFLKYFTIFTLYKHFCL